MQSIPELSIVIPSIRPESLRLCLSRLSKHDHDLNLEIIVVSPFKPEPYPGLKHIPEESPLGTAGATNLGFLNASGKFVLTFADDMLLNPGALNNLMRNMRAHQGELYLGSLRGYSAHIIWISGGFYGFNLAYCPCIERSQVEKIGGAFFDPVFRTAYNDHDLSLRVVQAGGQVEICADAWFESVSLEDQAKMANIAQDVVKDHQTFFERWEKVYGAKYEYARIHTAHLGDNKEVKEPLKGELPPEYSWQLRAKLDQSDWQGIRQIISDSSQRYHLSQNGINLFAEHLFKKAEEIPEDLFDDLTYWICDAGYDQNAQFSSARDQIELSIALPTCNRMEYLIQTLRCFISQIRDGLSSKIEILISDNASSDLTEKLMRCIAKRYPFISYTRNPTNLGTAKSLSLTLARCKGRFILAFGDDDLLVDGALKEILRILKTDPAKLLYLNKCVMNKDLSSLVLESQNYLDGDIVFKSALDLCSKFGFYTQFGFMSAIVFENRKELASLLDEYTPFETLYPQNAMLIESFHKDRCLYVSKPLIVHRQFNQCGLQNSSWPYLATVPSVRMFKAMKQKKLLTYRQLETMIETPLGAEPTTTLGIISNCFNATIDRGIEISFEDWIDTLQLFSSLSTDFYKDKIFDTHERYISKLIGNDQLEEALRHAEYRSCRQPERAKSQWALADIQAKLGQFEASIISMQRAINLEPEELKGYYALLEMLVSMGDNQRVIETLLKLFKVNQDDFNLIRFLVKLLMQTNQHEQSLFWCDVLTERESANLQNWILKGQLLLMNSRFTDATHVFQTVISADPQSASAFHGMAIALWHNNNPQGALEHARKAAELESGSERFQNTVKQMQEQLQSAASTV